VRIPLKAFGGMQPRVEPHLLPDTAAQHALNARLWSGKIGAFRQPQLVTALGKLGSKRAIYRFGKGLDDDARFWFHWLNDTDVARGPIVDDTQERTYFTEAGKPPMVTDATMATGDANMPTIAYRLGVPAPTARATLTVTQAVGNSDREDAQACLLAYTFVTGWDEEGPPNAVSDPVNLMSGDTLNVFNMEGPPAGAYNVTRKRLYLSVTDATGTAVLRYWAEVPAGAVTYRGVVDTTMLGEALPDAALIPPPENLFGLMSHPAGFMVGFSGKRVYRSEVFKPYGWPHFSPVADDIVGGAILGQGTVICTKGLTYFATQSDPQTFVPVQLDGWQPCVSKRSIQALAGGVAYASPDGLVMVSPTGVMSVVTEGLMTRDEWQAYKPESMHAAAHDGRYFCWYDTGAKRGGLILNLGAGTLELVETDVYATAAYADGRRDELFIVQADGNLYKWDAGAQPLAMSWRSKRFILERAQNVGAAMVVADAYPVPFRLTCTIETDAGPQTLQVDRTAVNGRPFRLLGNYRAREFEFTVSGPNAVREVTLASTLANVTAE